MAMEERLVEASLISILYIKTSGLSRILRMVNPCMVSHHIRRIMPEGSRIIGVEAGRLLLLQLHAPQTIKPN
jgi:hypothetical protein